MQVGSNLDGEPDSLESESTLALLHSLAKDIEWIRMLATRAARVEREPRSDAHQIQDLSEFSSLRLRSFLEGARRGSGHFGELVSAPSIIERAVEHVRARSNSADIRVAMDPGSRRWFVPRRFLLAIEAVLENALDAEGGPVAVALNESDGLLIIEVRDSGIGMGLDLVSQCREFGASTRRSSGGLGLGLYCATRIALESEGDLVVESIEGQGTRVLLLAPLRAAGTALATGAGSGAP